MATADTREEIFRKLNAWIMGELARVENRACKMLGLYYRSPGIGEERLLEFDREDPNESEFFDNPALTDRMLHKLLSCAEDHANTAASTSGNSKPRRYIVRTTQAGGGRDVYTFPVQPSVALVLDGDDEDGEGATKPLTGHALVGDGFKTAMRLNATMFDGMLRHSSSTISRLNTENASLSEENRALRREVDDLKSTRMEREWAMAKEKKREDRADVGFAKLIQLGTVWASRFLPPGSTNEGQASAVAMLVHQFFESLSDEQSKALLGILRQDQQMILFELHQRVVAERDAAAAAANGTNGATAGTQQANKSAHP